MKSAERSLANGFKRISVCSFSFGIHLPANQPLVNGKPANVTLPKNIAAGNYLIRHEIIALHLANKKFSGGKDTNGAEFYPSCSQLKITGNGTGVPKADELVALPGAYKDTDPGIFDKNVSIYPLIR